MPCSWMRTQTYPNRQTGPLPPHTVLWRAGVVRWVVPFWGSVLRSMARDVYLGLFVMTFVLILQLSLSPHYGSTSGIAPVRRDGVGFFGSEDPKVAVFAETHNEKDTSTQNHLQLNSLVGKASTKALTSVATVAARSRRATFVALDDRFVPNFQIRHQFTS